MGKQQFPERLTKADEIGRDNTDAKLAVFYDHSKDVRAWRENGRTTIGEGEILGNDDAATPRHRYAHRNPMVQLKAIPRKEERASQATPAL